MSSHTFGAVGRWEYYTAGHTMQLPIVFPVVAKPGHLLGAGFDNKSRWQAAVFSQVYVPKAAYVQATKSMFERAKEAAIVDFIRRTITLEEVVACGLVGQVESSTGCELVDMYRSQCRDRRLTYRQAAEVVRYRDHMSRGARVIRPFSSRAEMSIDMSCLMLENVSFTVSGKTHHMAMQLPVVDRSPKPVVVEEKTAEEDLRVEPGNPPFKMGIDPGKGPDKSVITTTLVTPGVPSVKLPKMPIVATSKVLV